MAEIGDKITLRVWTLWKKKQKKKEEGKKQSGDLVDNSGVKSTAAV